MADQAWHFFEQPALRRCEPLLFGDAIIGRRWTFVANIPIDRGVANAPAPLALPPAQGTDLAAAGYAGRARLGLDGPNIGPFGVRVKGNPVQVQAEGYIQTFITAVEAITRTS